MLVDERPRDLWTPRALSLHRPSASQTRRVLRTLASPFRCTPAFAASVKEAQGSATAFTISAAIASSGTVGRQSTVVDNSTNLYLDALVEVNIQFPNSAPANDKAIYVYAFGSLDGTNYTEGLGASDAAFTFQGAAGALTTQLRPFMTCPAVQNITARYGPLPVSTAFNGIMPAKWGIIVLNFSGQTLTACSAQYREIYQTVA